MLYGISRKTGYKWLERFKQGGRPAMVDQSRVAYHHPHAVSEEVVQLLTNLRRERPNWGPRKLLAILKRKHPSLALPAASTASEILRRLGLSRRRRKRLRSESYASPFVGYYGPNAVWSADFKGTMKARSKSCHPLTISDGFSRYLLRCSALFRQTEEVVQPIFHSAFIEFGLPDAIRTDNGPPFSTLALAGLSSLAVWWIKLGIRPERIRPGKPTENGRHERIHKTLKQELSRKLIQAQREPQREMDDFRRDYNEERPHEALEQRFPAEVYCPSPRAYPRKLRDPEYPTDYYVERVSAQGVLFWMGQSYYLAKLLMGELVGIQAVEDRAWRIYFGPVLLGVVDPQGFNAANKRKRTRTFKPVAQEKVSPMLPG